MSSSLRKSDCGPQGSCFFIAKIYFLGGNDMQSQQVKLWNKDFILIIVINFLVFMNHLMILSTFPFYIEYLGGSEAVAGFAAALFSIIAVVFRPFIGWMLDNGKRKIILIIGLCGMALMQIGYLVFATLYLAFVCRMLHGASLAFSNTSTSTIATDIIPKPDLPRAWECSVWQPRWRQQSLPLWALR